MADADPPSRRKPTSTTNTPSEGTSTALPSITTDPCSLKRSTETAVRDRSVVSTSVAAAILSPAPHHLFPLGDFSLVIPQQPLAPFAPLRLPNDLDPNVHLLSRFPRLVEVVMSVVMSIDVEVLDIDHVLHHDNRHTSRFGGRPIFGPTKRRVRGLGGGSPVVGWVDGL